MNTHSKTADRHHTVTVFKHREALCSIENTSVFNKYPVIVNKHAPQSQVEDILTLTATYTVANSNMFNRIT